MRREAIVPAIIAAALTGVAASPGLAGDCAIIDALDEFAATQAAPNGANCATYRTGTGGTGVSCYWAYAYRSAAAKEFADELWNGVAACRSGKPLAPDAPVNHPDSYALRQATDGRTVYAISIKDKGAVQRSMVFIRVAPYEPGR